MSWKLQRKKYLFFLSKFNWWKPLDWLEPFEQNEICSDLCIAFKSTLDDLKTLKCEFLRTIKKGLGTHTYFSKQAINSWSPLLLRQNFLKISWRLKKFWTENLRSNNDKKIFFALAISDSYRILLITSIFIYVSR